MMLPSALLLLTWLCLGHARPSAERLHPRKGSLPSDDPWYSPPDNLSDYKLGDIIRFRHPPSPIALYGFEENLADSWQVLYRTSDQHGKPLTTATTVLIPHDADFKKVLSYQVEIDAPWDGCFPSYTLQQANSNVGAISTQYGGLFYVSALGHGWVVSVPDYEGPNAAFLSGIIGGHAVLDGLKAIVQSHSITGVSPDAKLALWGYSGGAQATEFALELHANYAPELNIVGAAAGGIPSNPMQTVNATNKGIAAGVTASAILGLAKSDPELEALLNQELLPDKKADFFKAETQCVVPTVVQFAFQDVLSYFKDEGQGALSNPLLINALYEARSGQQTYKTPVHVYHAINDELLPIATSDTLHEIMCDGGANVEYIREAFGEHIIAAITGAAGALKFLMDRMDGKPFEGCTKQTVFTDAIDPKNIDVLGQLIYYYAITTLGRPIGMDSWLTEAS